MSKNRIIIVAIAGVLLLAGLYVYINFKPAASQQTLLNHSTTERGTIVENVDSFERGSPPGSGAYLRVAQKTGLFSGEEVTLEYNAGKSGCLGSINRSGSSFKSGEEIEFSAELSSDKKFSICSSKDYYITVVQ